MAKSSAGGPKLTFVHYCPFCGDNALIKQSLANGRWYVKCKFCGCQTAWTKKKRDAINLWNSRVEEPHGVQSGD